MKSHYHTAFEVLLINALATAVLFHAFRMVAGKMAGSKWQPVAKVGEATGGAFTFGALG